MVASRFNTGNKDDHIDVDGRFDLDQLTRGRFAELAVALTMQTTLAKVPETERVNLKLSITPAPAAAGQKEVTPPAWRPPPRAPPALRDDLRGKTARPWNSMAAMMGIAVDLMAATGSRRMSGWCNPISERPSYRPPERC
jgi:hypothetical protein